MKMATSENDSLLAVDKKFKDLLAKITDANVAPLPKSKNLFANDDDVSRKKNWIRPSMIDRAIRPLVSTSTPTPFNYKKLNFTPEKSIPVSPISCDASFKKKSSQLAEPLETNSEQGSKEQHEVNSEIPSAITLSSLTSSQTSKKHLKEDESIQTDFVAPQLQVSQVTSAVDPKMNEGENDSTRTINFRVTKLEKIIERLSCVQKKTPSIAKRLSTSDKPIQTSRKSSSQSLDSKKLARSMFTQTAKERQTQTGFSLIGQNRRSSDASSVSSGGSETSNFIADLETSKILNRSHLKVVVPPSYSDEEPTIHVDKPWRLPSRLNNNVEMPLFSSRQLSETDESSLDDTFLPKLPKKKKVFTNRKRILVGSAKKKKILSTDKDTQSKIVVLSDVKIANVEKPKEPNDETVENTVEKIERKQQSPLPKKSTRTSTQKKTKKLKEDEATPKQPVDNKKTPISKKSREIIKTTPRRITRSSLRSEYKQDISDHKILTVEENHVEKSTDVRRATWDSHCSEKSAKTKKNMEKKNSKQNKRQTKKENVSHQTEEKENTNFQVFEENLIENGESIEHVDKRTSTRIDHDIVNKEIQEETILEKKTKIITRECGTSPIGFEETAEEQTTEVTTNETNVKKTGTKKSKVNTSTDVTSSTKQNNKNEQTHRRTTKRTTVQIHREDRSPMEQIDFDSFSRMDQNSNEEPFKQIKKNVTNKRMTEKIPVEQNVTDAEETNKKGRNLNRKETIEDGVVDFEENATSETVVNTLEQQVKKKVANKQTASKNKKEIKQPRKSSKGTKRKIETDVEEFEQEVFHDDSMKTVRVTLESLPRDVPKTTKKTRENAKKSNITTLKVSSSEFSGTSSASSTNPDGLRRSTRERKVPVPRGAFLACKSEKDVKALNRVLGVSQIKRNSKMINSRNTNITSSSSSSVNPMEYDTMNRRTFEPIQESLSEYNAEIENVSKSKNKKPTRNIKSGRVSKVKTKNATNDPLKILKRHTRLSTTVEPVEIPTENFLSVYDGVKLHTFPWACLELNYHSLDDTLGISMTHCVANPTLGTTSGLLKIEPGKNKPKQLTKQHSMNFFIVDGKAEVGVQDKRKVMSKFNTFVVPRGSEYYIKNLSEKKALILYFTKAIPRDC